MFHKKIIFLLFLFLCVIVFSQNKKRKEITATRVEEAPKIDGNLSDKVWRNVATAKNFIVLKPDNGKEVSKKFETQVKLVYDNEAIYISAKMADPEPNKIPQQFATRDNFSQADFFSVTINPNDDGQNPFRFILQVTGNQLDAKVSNGNNDYNWSAVWEGATKLTKKGWNAEFKIPYRCIRFSNEPVQSWGFNFIRRVERKNEEHSWNFINNAVGIWTQYDGLISGFKNIQPPTRLNLYPYASVVTKTFDGETEFDWNVGMDIKYGLSENFTLDATLIPDFSQAGFDDVSLNLGPFEQEFSEQRQFFTEGTELFTKGRLFYSRRIGGSPINQFDVYENLQKDKAFVNNKKITEEVVEYPEKVNMLNAIKISGRTKGGLGLGLFNAITETTKATIKKVEENIVGLDTISTVSNYEKVTNPFSNYNILVADYQFNKNSAITLINTNVTRNGKYRDANATGLLWHIEDKSSTYNIDGAFKTTLISDVTNPTTGYMFDTSIGKGAGNWFWELGYNFENKDYDPNDMGILFSNNEQAIYGSVGYKILQPKGKFNQFRINFWNNAQFQHYSGIYTGYRAGINIFSQLKPRFGFGGNINFFTKRKDFNEPRHSKGNLGGVFFNRPKGVNVNHWGSSNYLKRLAVDYNFYQTLFVNDKKHSYGFNVKPRYRVNNQFLIIYGFKFGKTDNDRGYVDSDKDNTFYFGQRNRTSYNNTLSGKYNFSTKSSLALAFRHNWTKVLYDGNYFELQKNGDLKPITYKGADDINFNSWNIDVNYQWQLAPGSQLIALYRNSINPDVDFAEANISFLDNIDALFNEKMQHTFSVRLVYFIDYNKVKNIL